MVIETGSLTVRGSGQANKVVSQVLLSAPEADRLVQSLAPLRVEQVGGERWQEQAEAVTALNLQAHHSAAAHEDEFVKEALVLHDKLRVLVFDLLTFEAWKHWALPLLWGHIASKVDTVAAYKLLYHEAALTSLLEAALYHEDACEALGEDAALELVDWAGRRLLWLHSAAGRACATPAKARTAKEMLEVSAEQQLREQAAEIEFGAAHSGLTILRYLTDRMKVLPLAVAARLISPNDMPALLAALLHEPPWQRRVKGKKGVEKYEGGSWRPAERLVLGLPEIQAWLALSNLLLEPATRGHYDLDTTRAAALVRLRRLLPEPVQEQLPVARDIARVLEAVEAGAPLQDSSTDSARLIMEQVPVMREAILKSVTDWAALAEEQKATSFAAGGTAQGPAARRHERMLAAVDLMCDMGADSQAAQRPQAAAAPERDLAVKLTVEAEVSAGTFDAWETYALRIDAVAEAEAVSVAGADGGAPVHGTRCRLQAVEARGSRVLPSHGRVSLAHSGRSMRARLALPSAEMRTTSDLAEVIWMTAGRLGVEGLAFQLKLQRTPRASERDKLSGTWNAYHIVGGALAAAEGAAQGSPDVETKPLEPKDVLNF